MSKDWTGLLMQAIGRRCPTLSEEERRALATAAMEKMEEDFAEIDAMAKLPPSQRLVPILRLHAHNCEKVAQSWQMLQNMEAMDRDTEAKIQSLEVRAEQARTGGNDRLMLTIDRERNAYITLLAELREALREVRSVFEQARQALARDFARLQRTLDENQNGTDLSSAPTCYNRG